MTHVKLLTLVVLLILVSPLGGCWLDMREVSDLYELDTNRYRLEARIGGKDIYGEAQVREYAEERKVLYTKAKGHCEKDGKSLKVYSLGQQTLGTASQSGFGMAQGVAVGASHSAPVVDSMVIEFGCVEKQPGRLEEPAAIRAPAASKTPAAS